MDCGQCRGIEKVFDQKEAKKDLKRYRKKGPSDTTRMLVEAIKEEGVQQGTVLDIGGGVGAIQYELLDAGASGAVSVDASTAYVEAAKAEAQRRGHGDRISHIHGNFVEVAPDIEPADIVTLDKVICCYDDVEGLVDLSSQRAARLYGVVLPVTTGCSERRPALQTRTSGYAGDSTGSSSTPQRSWSRWSLATACAAVSTARPSRGRWRCTLARPTASE